MKRRRGGVADGGGTIPGIVAAVIRRCLIKIYYRYRVVASNNVPSACLITNVETSRCMKKQDEEQIQERISGVAAAVAALLLLLLLLRRFSGRPGPIPRNLSGFEQRISVSNFSESLAA
jgi:hypothetical protein